MAKRPERQWGYSGRAGKRRNTGKPSGILAWWRRLTSGGQEPGQKRYPSFVLPSAPKKVRPARGAPPGERKRRSVNEMLIWSVVGVVALAFIALLIRQAPVVGLGALAVVLVFVWWEFGRKKA